MQKPNVITILWYIAIVLIVCVLLVLTAARSFSAPSKRVPVKKVTQKVPTRKVVKLKKAQPARNKKLPSRGYCKTMHVVATAYCPCRKCCGRYADGFTATGARAGYGVIAVDPRMIKLGTKVYVPGYGQATALDVGGAIKGQRIDVCFPSHREALIWGRRTVEIRLYPK